MAPMKMPLLLFKKKKRKAVKAIKPETINSHWRKLCPVVVHDFTAFTTDPVKEIMEEYRYSKKRWRVKGFKIGILEKFKS